MNGDSQELLKAIKEWGKERHEENLAKFEKIFARLEGVLGVKKEVELHRYLIIIVIIGGIVLGLWAKLITS